MIDVKVPLATEKQIMPLTMKKMEKIFYDVVPTYTDITVADGGNSGDCEIKAGEVNMVGFINPGGFIFVSLYLSDYHPDATHDVA